MKNYLKIGKFDISKYDKKTKTTTNDVILTMEQLIHIIDKHPEVLKHLNKIKRILKDPDLIFREIKHKDTIWIIKKLENNLKITIKLNTIKYGINNYKNSIIQMQYLRDKEIRRNIRSNIIIKIFDKNKEDIIKYS